MRLVIYFIVMSDQEDMPQFDSCLLMFSYIICVLNWEVGVFHFGIIYYPITIPKNEVDLLGLGPLIQ